MKKSILALPACVVLTTLVYADAVFVNGPMKFRPIAASAYEQTTSDPAILNSKPWVIPKDLVNVLLLTNQIWIFIRMLVIGMI